MSEKLEGRACETPGVSKVSIYNKVGCRVKGEGGGVEEVLREGDVAQKICSPSLEMGRGEEPLQLKEVGRFVEKLNVGTGTSEKGGGEYIFISSPSAIP